MARLGPWICSGVAVGLLLASCSSSGVELTRSDQIVDETAAPPTASDPSATDPATTDPATSDPSATDPATTEPGPGDLPSVDAVAWGPCDQQPAPWQCGVVGVPMDYSRPDGEQIAIALNRLPAAGGPRIGSLVLNPGGPGGSGLEIAFDEAPSFPQEILDTFDIVGFDPRGVGRSTAVRCPADFDPDDADLTPCIDLTGELIVHLGTPNVARDLEQIRKAVGDEQLTYLGYSYGTALGAVYADLFPDRIRAMVLDGAIDPDAGLSNVDGGGGYDFYAEQDFEGTLEVFHTLCDATTRCSAGPDSHGLLDQVYDTVRDTPAPYFADGAHLRRSDVDDALFSAMYGARNWPILGIALRDAADGDASTLAALLSWLQFGYPADMESEPNFDLANIAIRCADFANRGSGSFECQQFPDSAESLPVITSIDAGTPVLVVGTDDDPATPGRYADELADALGDAVDIDWEGAGHTAFLTSGCITGLVTRYIVDQVVPVDGTTCPFVTGASTLEQRADRVFEDLDRDQAIESIVPLLGFQGVPARLTECVAEGIVDTGDQRLIVHELLGVGSPDIAALRSVALLRCSTGR
jgi:pimeloyl-ACP methyl ester carboxylesterase